MAGLLEVDFGKDDFGKPKVLTAADSLSQYILNVLLLHPGQLPSMPHLGIGISKYMYSFDVNIDTDGIKKRLIEQCTPILPYIESDSIIVNTVTLKDQSVLMIIVPLSLTNEQILIGFKKIKDTNKLVFNYQIVKTE